MLSAMRVLIVGCGYVGQALGETLARRGDEVFGLRRSPVADAALRERGIIPVHADLTRPETWTALPRPVQWVVNCAAADRSHSEAYRQLYVEGNRNLVDWLTRSGSHAALGSAKAGDMRLEKFVYTSSTGVYGQDDGSWVTEHRPTTPSGETGRALVAAEQVLLDAARERGFPAVILRVAGIYGPGRGYYLRSFLEGSARLEGDGSRFVNMIHRDDLVAAILAALERGQPGAIYNVCDDEPTPQREVYAWLAARLGRPLPPALPEDSEAIRRRSVTNKRVANQRLRAELCWRPRYPTFREGYAAELARQPVEGQ